MPVPPALQEILPFSAENDAMVGDDFWSVRNGHGESMWEGEDETGAAMCRLVAAAPELASAAENVYRDAPFTDNPALAMKFERLRKALEAAGWL